MFGNTGAWSSQSPINRRHLVKFGAGTIAVGAGALAYRHRERLAKIRCSSLAAKVCFTRKQAQHAHMLTHMLQDTLEQHSDRSSCWCCRRGGSGDDGANKHHQCKHWLPWNCSISRLFSDDILFECQQPASSNARATVTKYSGAFMSQLIV